MPNKVGKVILCISVISLALGLLFLIDNISKSIGLQFVITGAALTVTKAIWPNQEDMEEEHPAVIV